MEIKKRLENFQIENRKEKQNYLLNNIINKNYDPIIFSEFLDSKKKRKKKEDGKNIDNWKFDELENLVKFFKSKKEKNLKIEDIFLEIENFENIYIKKILCSKKKKSLFFEKKIKICIDSLKLCDGGFFYGKYIEIILEVVFENEKFTILRNVEDFKNLYEILKIEFPNLILPPLVLIKNNYIEIEDFGLLKYLLEKFINFILEKKELKNSLIFETFMFSKKKEIFEEKSKNIKFFFEENNLINNNLSFYTFKKQNFDIVKKFQSFKKKKIIKNSENINNFFKNAKPQYLQYEKIFEKINIISKEYENTIKQLLIINKNFEHAFKELNSLSLKFNNNKKQKNIYNIFENDIFEKLNNFFKKEENFFENKISIFRKSFSNFSVFFKNYFTNINNGIKKRNFFFDEYLTNKKILDLKKQKILKLNPKFWEIDLELSKITNIKIEEIKKNSKIAKNFIFKKETLKIRKFADIFLFINYSIFLDIKNFEEIFFKELFKNFKWFCKKNEDNVRKDLEFFKNCKGFILDIKKVFL